MIMTYFVDILAVGESAWCNSLRMGTDGRDSVVEFAKDAGVKSDYKVG